VTLAVAPAARGASIGVFSDPNCTSCNLNVALGESKPLYVAAVDVSSTPQMCNGLFGAEFRVVGLPLGWQTTIQPNPQANVSLGNPLQCGANIGFPSRRVGNCINLYTVQVQATTTVVGIVLFVDAHCTPSNPNFVCPLLVPDCFEPWPMCVPGGRLFINSPNECTFAVHEGTWSVVKQLYFD
jgi:hypothetical protein